MPDIALKLKKKIFALHHSALVTYFMKGLTNYVDLHDLNIYANILAAIICFTRLSSPNDLNESQRIWNKRNVQS